MDDFAKKLIVLVLLIAFFGALFLEFPLIYKKIKNGEIPIFNSLILPTKPASRQKQKISNSEIYSRNNSKNDHSQSSPICIPAIDGENC